MGNTKQLSELRLEAQQQADFVNSTYISTPELNTYINDSYQELYDILIQAYGNDYFVSGSPYSFTTTGGTQFYSLPTDFYKLLGIDLVVSTGSNITIPPFSFQDRNRYSTPNFQSFYGATNLRYRLYGTQLWLSPIPSASQTINVWYVPQLAYLVNDSDTASDLGGWLRYVVVDTAIKMRIKEESEVGELMAEKQSLLARIEAAAENRDPGSPSQVTDKQSNDCLYPGFGFNGYGGS